MTLDRIRIVLVRPARAANVAAACRAMKNMGLRRLVLVQPPRALSKPEARASAYGAWDVLDGAATAATLGEAVGAAQLVVGTSSRPLAEAWTPRRLAAEGGSRAGAGEVAIVFGPEATGLTSKELALCHLRVRVPTDPEQPSLNLAQAVLIVAYELFTAALPAETGPVPAPATVAELETLLSQLEPGLLAIGYLNPQSPGAVLAELRRLLARAGPTRRELALLRGLARQLRWAGGIVARSRGSAR